MSSLFWKLKNFLNSQNLENKDSENIIKYKKRKNVDISTLSRFTLEAIANGFRSSF